MRKQEFEEKIEKYVFDVMKELGMDNELVMRKTLKQILPPGIEEHYGAFLLITAARLKQNKTGGVDEAEVAMGILAELGDKNELMESMQRWYPERKIKDKQETNKNIFQ